MKKSVAMSFSGLPGDVQGLILGYLPLRDLAQWACWSRRARPVYLERIRERDELVADLLQSHFTAQFREGLFPTQMALPRDLIGTSREVRGLWIDRPSSLRAYYGRPGCSVHSGVLCSRGRYL